MSFNQLDMNKDQLDTFLTDLKNNFKKLKSVNFDSNPFVMKLMNYRALFITRLPQISQLDMKEISSKDRKEAAQNDSGQQLAPLFFDEVGEQLRGTSRGLMKRVPSFANLFSVLHDPLKDDEPVLDVVDSNGRRPTIVESIKEQSHFEKINGILEHTSQIYLLVAGQKLLRTMKLLLGNITDFSMKIHEDDPNMIGLRGYSKFIELLKSYISREESHAIREIFIRCLVTSFAFYSRSTDNATRDEIQVLTELGKFLFWNTNNDILRTTNQCLHQFVLSQKGKFNQQPISNLCSVLKYFEDRDSITAPKISTPQELNRLSIKLKKPLTDEEMLGGSPSYLIPNFSERRRSSNFVGPMDDGDSPNAGAPASRIGRTGSVFQSVSEDSGGSSILSTVKSKKLQGISKFYQEFMTNQFKSFSSSNEELPNEMIQLQIQACDHLIKTFNFTDALTLAMTESDFFDHIMLMIIDLHQEFKNSPTKPTTLQPQVQRYVLLLRLFSVTSACADTFTGKIISLTEHWIDTVYFSKINPEEVQTVNDEFIQQMIVNYSQNHFSSCLGAIHVALASICHVSKLKDDMFQKRKFMDFLLATLSHFLKNGLTTACLKQVLGSLDSIDTLLSIYHYKMVKHQTTYVTSSRTLVRATGDVNQMTDESFRLQGMQNMITIDQLHVLQQLLLELLAEEHMSTILINPTIGLPLATTILHLIQMLPLLNINKHLDMVNDPQYCDLLQKRLIDLVLVNTINTPNTDNSNSSLSVSCSLELNRLAAQCFISVIRETNIEKDILKRVVAAISALSREAGYRGTKLNHSFELCSLLGILSSVKKEELLSEYKDVLLIQLLRIIQQLTVDLSTKQLYYTLIDQCIRLLRVLQPAAPQEQLDFEQFGKLFILIIRQEQQIERENPQLFSIENFEENSSFNGLGIQISDTSSRNQTLTVESLPLFANQYIILLKCISELEISSFICLRIMIRLVDALESMSSTKFEKEFISDDQKERREMVDKLLTKIIDLVSKPTNQESDVKLSAEEMRKVRRKSLRKSISMSTRSFESTEAMHTASEQKVTNESRRGSLRLKKRSSLKGGVEELSGEKQPNYTQMLNYGMFDQYSINFWNERTFDLTRQLHALVLEDVSGEWRDELKSNPFQSFNPFYLENGGSSTSPETVYDKDEFELSADSDLSSISSTDSDDNDDSESPSKINRIHRKSGTKSEFVDLLRRKRTDKPSEKKSNPTTMWSFYDDVVNSFSANDFYRLVFSDELSRDNVYDVMTQSVNNKKISLSQLLSDKQLKLLFIGIVGLRIINMIKSSTFGASQVIPLIYQILSSTLFGSYRLNLLAVKTMTNILENQIQKTVQQQGTALRNVTNQKAKGEAWREIVILMDQIAQITQQMNNTLRYRLQFHFTQPIPFSSDERHFLYNYVKLWHLMVTSVRYIPFHLLTDSKECDNELLNELCQSQTLSFWLLPLPDFAVLLRMLYYHSITEHLPDSDDTRDNRLFGNMYKIQYLEELVLPLYSVTNDKQELSGNSTQCQYMNQKRKLNTLLSEICGIYMKYDRFNLYNVLDFIVRLAPSSDLESSNSYYSVISSPSLRNSLLEQLLKEETQARHTMLLCKTLSTTDVLGYDKCTINGESNIIILHEKKFAIYKYSQHVKTGKIFLSETQSIPFNQVQSIHITSPFSGRCLGLKTAKETYYIQFTNDTLAGKIISNITTKHKEAEVMVDWRLHKLLQTSIFTSGVDEQLLFYGDVVYNSPTIKNRYCSIALTNYSIYFVEERISKDISRTSEEGLIERLYQYDINELVIDTKQRQEMSSPSVVKLVCNENPSVGGSCKGSIYCTFPSDNARIAFTSYLSSYQSVSNQ